MEAAATAVLASRLLSHAGVTCSVDCSFPGLLGGRVEGACIAGKAWVSRKRLTCRSLDFRVGGAELDAGALMTRGVLALRAPSRGGGAVVFTASDFSNFLAHPLFTAAAATAVARRRFTFAPSGVAFQPGGVAFTGAFDGAQYACVLHVPPPALQEANLLALPPPRAVTVEARGGGDAGTVSAGLSHFFSTLVIDLEGTRLSYADMQLAPGDGTLTLRLALQVTRFPRADFAF